MNWENESVLITAGSYEGVSKALALKAQELKSEVVVIARARNSKLKGFKKQGNIYVYPFNFQKINEVPGLYRSIVDTMGKHPTVLINDIRYQIAGFVKNTPAEHYMKSYRGNVLFLIALIQCMLPDMLRQNKGTIANIMSAVIYHSYPGISAYFAAKAALGAVHESLRAELSGTGIKTLYVRPGGYLSNYWKMTDIGGRFKDIEYPGYEDIRDTNYVVSHIFKAIEKGKVEINLGSIKDRIGFHLSYWAPKMLDKIIAGRNKELITTNINR